MPSIGVADVEWDIGALAALEPAAAGIDELLVIENKTSFLTAPTAPGRLLLWGVGYGAGDLLSTLPWRDRVAVRCWDDIDTHGFAILNHVRQIAPHTVSVLMDADMLLAHRPYWGTETTPRKDPLTALTLSEAALYDALCSDGCGPAVRLEKEYVRFDLVRRRLPRKAGRGRHLTSSELVQVATARACGAVQPLGHRERGFKAREAAGPRRCTSSGRHVERALRRGASHRPEKC